jgi:hypothetical protein
MLRNSGRYNIDVRGQGRTEQRRHSCPRVMKRHGGSSTRFPPLGPWQGQERAICGKRLAWYSGLFPDHMEKWHMAFETDDFVLPLLTTGQA